MATPAALPPLPINPARIRSYLLRLPLFTRLVLLVIVAFWLLELQTIWSVEQWGALIPEEVNLGTSMFGFIKITNKAHADDTSVPLEHLPFHPHWVLAYFIQYSGPCTITGAI